MGEGNEDARTAVGCMVLVALFLAAVAASIAVGAAFGAVQGAVAFFGLSALLALLLARAVGRLLE